MNRLKTLAHLARAESRRAHGTLGFCTLCVALGVFSITLVSTLSDSLRHSVHAQAKQLLGADLVLGANQPLEREEVAQQLSAQLEQLGAETATLVRFYSMIRKVDAPPSEAAAPNRAPSSQSQFVRLAAPSPNYPLRGQIQTDPPDLFQRLAERPSVLVDPGIASALQLRPGDAVRVGQLEAVVLGQFVKEPGSPTAAFSMAPYVYLAERYLPQTGLLAQGSRIRYERVFALPPGQDPLAWKRENYSKASAAHLRLRSYDEAGSGLQRLSDFLAVLALVTLFLGAYGVGSGLQAFLGRKWSNAAILRSVGASTTDVLWVYGLLTARIAVIGGALGATAGALLPVALASLLGDLGRDVLPIDLQLDVSGAAIARGVGAGLLSCAAFALLPLWRTAHTPPLRVLNGRANSSDSPDGSASGRLGLVATTRQLLAQAGPYAVLGLLIGGALLVMARPEARGLSLAFSAGLAAIWAVLLGLAWVTAKAARKLSPRLGSFALRQGIANLHRPGNQTRSVVVAVAMGFVLLGSLLTVRQSLHSSLSLGDNAQLPNLFVIEAQRDQVQAIVQDLEHVSAERIETSPMVSARLGALNGQPIDTADVASNAEQRDRADRLRTREYFLSYRDHLVDSEIVVSGEFWHGKPARQEASLAVGVAQALGAEIGDTLTLDVQGRPLEAVITSFREIQWLSLRPNAMVLLSPGPIEAAPGMVVLSARVTDEHDRRQLQQALVARHPNLTVIDAEQSAQAALLLVDQIATVVNALGLLAVMAGAFVFAGAIAAGRFARQRESMLLKVLGAEHSTLRRILVAEYFSLASLAVGCGWALCEAVNRVAIQKLFAVGAELPYGQLLALAVAVIGLNVLVALGVGRQVTRTTALSLLREAS